MPDDHSEVVPLLPIPNRTVKRFSADDSADTRVKVGHRQALTAQKAHLLRDGLFVSIKCVSSFYGRPQCCQAVLIASVKTLSVDRLLKSVS